MAQENRKLKGVAMRNVSVVLLLLATLALSSCGSPLEPTVDLGPLDVAPALALVPVNMQECFRASGGNGKYTWEVILGSGIVEVKGNQGCYTSALPEQFKILVSSSRSGTKVSVIVGGRTFVPPSPHLVLAKSGVSLSGTAFSVKCYNPHMFQKTINSFTFALKGLITVWQEEYNFRIEIIVALAAVFCIFYFNFSFIESALCIVAITTVLSAEIMNTIIEDLCNKVEPSYDSVIGKIKDTAGAFVLLSALGSLALGILVFYHHFL